MVETRPHHRRWSFLGSLSEFGTRSARDQHVFWIVTSFIALWLFLSVCAELLFTLHFGLPMDSDTWLAMVLGMLAGAWGITACIRRDKLPLWVGMLGFVIAALVLVRNIAAADNVLLVSTSLQVLPVFALYLGWFWRTKHSAVVFLLLLSGVSSTLLLSPLVGPESPLTTFVAFFTVLSITLAFVLASFLRTKLHSQAQTDPLTGADNLRGLKHKILYELRRAAHKQEPLVLAAIDFDGFKQLNDRYGHTYGDEALRSEVRQWRKLLRGYDTIARTGGDEFAIILPNTTQQQGEEVLNRLHEHSQYSWSWGLTQSQTADSYESLATRADAHLYQAKQRRSSPNARPPRLNTTEKTASPSIQNRRTSHSHFSFVSALVGAVVFIPLLLGLISGEAAEATPTVFVGVCVLAGVGFTLVILPLTIPHKYPESMTLINSVVLLVTYVFMAFATDHFEHQIGVLHAVSVPALYLGLFSGTLMSRILLTSGILLVSVPTLTRVFPDGSEEHQALAVITIGYAFIVSLMLFESGSFLYSKAKANAEKDGLTGALNRYGLEVYGVPETLRAKRQGYPLSCVAIDCINFKFVNDRYGHAAGDSKLIELTRHIEQLLQPGDIFARVGGDEFTLLLPYTSLSQADKRVHDMLLSAPHPFRYGIVQQEAGENYDSLIIRADTHLTEAQGDISDREAV